MGIEETKFHKTSLDRVLLIEPGVHMDSRGFNHETFNFESYQKGFSANGINVPINFVLDSFARSKKNVFRGIHGDDSTWKLLYCTAGKVQLYVVDCRQEKPTYGISESFELSDENRLQVLVPPRFGNGHLVLSNYANFNYKMSNYRKDQKQFTFKYNDPRFNIILPLVPLTSDRDSVLTQAQIDRIKDQENQRIAANLR